MSYDVFMEGKLTGSQDIASSIVDAVVVTAVQEVNAQDAFDIIESMGLSC